MIEMAIGRRSCRLGIRVGCLHFLFVVVEMAIGRSSCSLGIRFGCLYFFTESSSAVRKEKIPDRYCACPGSVLLILEVASYGDCLHHLCYPFCVERRYCHTGYLQRHHLKDPGPWKVA